MKLVKMFSIAGLMAVMLSGCMSAQVARLDDPKAASYPPLFLDKLPEQNYEEIAFVTVTGTAWTTRQELVRKLRKTAHKSGMDGLIHIKFDYQGYWPIVEAVGVKYTSN